MDTSGEVYGLYCVCGDCHRDRPEVIRYVGVTIEGREKRLRGHLNEALRGDSPKAKDRWIRKHGSENIRSMLLEEVTTSIEDLRVAEIAWIAKLGTFGNLNMTRGGDGIWGYRFSDETKERFRERTAEQMAVKHPRAKLDFQDVVMILNRLWDGESPSNISEDYPVTSFSIQKISDGLNWPNVPRPIGPRNRPVDERMSRAWITRRLVD